MASFFARALPGAVLLRSASALAQSLGAYFDGNSAALFFAVNLSGGRLAGVTLSVEK